MHRLRLPLFVLLCSFVILTACASHNAQSAAPGAGPIPAGSFDVVIENGRIIDGTGAAWFYGDVGVVGDRIARIAPPGTLRSATAKQRIDARGQVVAPGFIDIQSGSYGNFVGNGDGRSVSKITQGITTEIMGEGGTPAPLNPATRQSGGFALGNRADDSSFSGAHGFAAWLGAMARHGSSPNVGSFVGAATIRVYAKGEAQGTPTPAELDTMRAVTRRAMEDGAFGIGSALIYPPGNYATTGELIEMAKAMSPYGGVYITHMRSASVATVVCRWRSIISRPRASATGPRQRRRSPRSTPLDALASTCKPTCTRTPPAARDSPRARHHGRPKTASSLRTCKTPKRAPASVRRC
jgi:dihydroorotase/N-acyl-D-amino-acid deacylase